MSAVFVQFRCADQVSCKLCFIVAMSQHIFSSDSVGCESSSSAKSHSGRLLFPGRVTGVDRTDESLSSDVTSTRQNPVTLQSSMNPSFEVRSRKRSVPLQRGFSDSCVSDQLELMQLDKSPVASHGHRFISANLSQPTWCDKCGDFIWGIYKQCLICTSTFALFLLQLICCCIFVTQLIVNSLPTQPPTLNGKGNEYQPNCGDALWLESKAAWFILQVGKHVGGR